MGGRFFAGFGWRVCGVVGGRFFAALKNDIWGHKGVMGLVRCGGKWGLRRREWFFGGLSWRVLRVGGGRFFAALKNDIWGYRVVGGGRSFGFAQDDMWVWVLWGLALFV